MDGLQRERFQRRLTAHAWQRCRLRLSSQARGPVPQQGLPAAQDPGGSPEDDGHHQLLLHTHNNQCGNNSWDSVNSSSGADDTPLLLLPVTTCVVSVSAVITVRGGQWRPAANDGEGWADWASRRFDKTLPGGQDLARQQGLDYYNVGRLAWLETPLPPTTCGNHVH